MKLSLRALIALSIVSLAGLAALQAFMIFRNYKMLDENFDRNVYLAMNQVSRQLTRQTFGKHFLQELDTNLSNGEHLKVQLKETFDSFGKSRDIDVQRHVFINTESELDSLPKDSSEIRVWTGQILEELMIASKDPMEYLDTAKADSLIKAAFNEYKLPVPEFSISDKKNSPLFKTEDYHVNSFPGLSFESELFPDHLFADPLTVNYVLSNRVGFILSQLLLPIIISFAFLLITALLFFTFIRKYQRQRQLAEMRNDLINSMSHELKTPVSTVRLATANLRNKTGASDQLLSIIEDENHRMEMYIQAVLDLSKAENSISNNHYKPASIKELIQRIAIKQSALHSNFSFVNQHDATILMDPLSLENALSNILENAFKYSKEDSPVHLSTEIIPGNFLIHIKDEGRGIPEAELVNIFDKFYRVPSGDLYDVQGTGLGLSYAKTIVELHGGTISVISQFGTGSTFTISLPIE